MSDSLAALQKRFDFPGLLRFEQAAGGLVRAVVTAPAANAEIYLQGAHLTHFQPNGEQPVLMVSARSVFAPGKAIRGGVPICWPWFGPRADPPPSPPAPASPLHGFARLAEWELESITPEGDAVALRFSLGDTPATRATWPHAFNLRYRVTVGKALTLALETTNTGDAPFTFTEALHPYFRISDICNISLTGLENTAYVDKVTGQEKRQGPEPIRFDGRTDNVYQQTTTPVTIHDPGFNRRIVLTKENSRSTVVWNPGDQQKLPDLADREWAGMVCVEPANALDLHVTLAPGQSHTLKTDITLFPL